MKIKQIVFIFLAVLIGSCKVYRQDILFTTDEQTQLAAAVYEAEKNYIIAPNDWLKVNMFPNKGEQLIDPNFEPLMRQQAGNLQMMQQREQFRYLVQADGNIKLPMLGNVSVAGLTIDEAEAIIEKAYSNYFNDAFAKVQFLNKRVIIFSQMGSTVVPIENENTSLIEVLAAAGGLKFGEKAQNIRVIRGELNNPEVFVVDISTVDGLKSSIIQVQPGDIIYIEPWRRPWLESLRDISPILGVASSITTLIFIIINISGG